MKGEALTAYGVQRKEAQHEVSSPRDGNTASIGPDWYANSGEGWEALMSRSCSWSDWI
jgi:hypothetical protein